MAGSGSIDRNGASSLRGTQYHVRVSIVDHWVVLCMALSIDKFRKLVDLDPDDALSRFALGQALFRDATPEATREAVEHLTIANQAAPDHLATYHILGQALIKLGRKDEARSVLRRGCDQVRSVGQGMGRDLGPVLEQLLESLD